MNLEKQQTVFFIRSTRFDFLQVHLETLQRLLRHVVQAIPDTVEDTHVLGKRSLQFRQLPGRGDAVPARNHGSI